MKAIDIDVAGRTAWAESGLTAGEYTTAVGAHGLATGFGDTGSVGLGGITLGGGVGYLGRKFGLTIDSLLAAEIVTADGELLRVDAETHPDLFWAIRGGGGNFGVATRFQFRLHDVGAIVGGMLILPATPETVAGFIAAAEAAPDELSTIANVMPCPPMPFVARGATRPARDPGAARATPARPRPASVPSRRSGRWRRPSPTWSSRCHTRRSTRPTIPTTTRRRSRGRCSSTTSTGRSPRRSSSGSRPPMRRCASRSSGCSVAPLPASRPTPPRIAHRRSRIMVNVAAFYEGPDDRTVREAWVTDFAAALLQGDRRRLRELPGRRGRGAVRAAYPGATWDRLAAIKARYDPTNLFRLQPEHPTKGLIEDDPIEGDPGRSRRLHSSRPAAVRRNRTRCE